MTCLFSIPILLPETNTIVAIAAAAITFIQMIFNWLELRQSVKPFLHLGYGEKFVGNENCLVITLVNSGLGPAIINDYKIVFKNNDYRDTEIDKLLRKQFGQQEKFGNLHNWFVAFYRPNTAIGAGQTEDIICIPLKLQTEEEAIINVLERDYKLCVNYKSFHGQPFDYNSKDTHKWPKFK